MTSYAEVECEDTDCGHKWLLFFDAEHICPMCSKQQTKDGFIFDEYAVGIAQRIEDCKNLYTHDETGIYIEKLCALLDECERIYRQYESDPEYRKGKRLEGFEEFGYRYHYLMNTKSFDKDLLDLPKWLLKLTYKL